MRFEVSEDALFAAAAAVARAAALVASLDLEDVATSVALAMPGSRSAACAGETVGLLSHLTGDQARELSGHADALRLAGVGYVEADRALAAAERQERKERQERLERLERRQPGSPRPTPEGGAA
jgi:hypothetical protein